MSSRIEDYALIGDCQTAGLVSQTGSIDWLCFPRFDSPACFAALLGTPEHGRWRIAPAGRIESQSRRYRSKTLILETESETAQGRVRMIDFMPPRTREPDVVRIVEGLEGVVSMEMELCIRFDYGVVVPWVRHQGSSVRATAGPDTIDVHSSTAMHGEEMQTVARFDVEAGQRIPFTLTWSRTHEAVPEFRNANEQLRNTERWWRDWCDRCTYDGEWYDAVLRSLITLKALTYSRTGGLVAAATTSLPEYPGGVRNWDYRFCWLRDASFTLHALISGGYLEEAKRWRDWLVNAVAGNPAQAQIMYSVTGERRLTELELDSLPGYEDSRPVRIGNAAANQFQLDIYGEVMETLHVARRHGLSPDENAWRVQRALLGHLEAVWQQPDEGIWEVRGPRKHFTHSKVMAWLAFARGVQAVEEYGLDGDATGWRRLRDTIHEEVCRKGFCDRRQSFVQSYDSEHLDASLLVLPLVGFLPPEDPRVQGTVAAVQQHLMRDGLLYRYQTSQQLDDLPPGEGAFFLCAFWLTENLALQGRLQEAREMFERMLSLRNDVGLLSEEYDASRDRMLGNFPQALSHLALVNAASHLSGTHKPVEVC